MILKNVAARPRDTKKQRLRSHRSETMHGHLFLTTDKCLLLSFVLLSCSLSLALSFFKSLSLPRPHSSLLIWFPGRPLCGARGAHFDGRREPRKHCDRLHCPCTFTTVFHHVEPTRDLKDRTDIDNISNPTCVL